MGLLNYYITGHRKRLRKLDCLTKEFKQWKGLKGTVGDSITVFGNY